MGKGTYQPPRSHRYQYPAGISSLTCKKLVEYVAAKSEVTTDEIAIVEKALHTPLTFFTDFPDFIATLNMNYSFLKKNQYVLPPLMQIQLLVDALQAFPQFSPYITIYNCGNSSLQYM